MDGQGINDFLNKKINMIHQVTMWAAKCDHCGKEWDNGAGTVAYTDKVSMQTQLDESWHVDARHPTDMHYCEDCFRGFDEEDQIILRNKQKTNEIHN